MATHLNLNPVQWDNNQKLHLIKIPPKQHANSSFLYSQKLKKNLEESRKAFLNIHPLNHSNNSREKMTEAVHNQEQVSNHRSPAKKISFKIKKSASIYKKTTNSVNHSNSNTNKVAELTKKFNTLSEKSILEQPKFRELVNRVNSQRSVESDKNSRKSSVKTREVTRKPSVKTKPIFNNDERLVIKRRIIRKPSVNNNSSNQMCIRARISYLETPHVPKFEEQTPRPTSLNLPILPPKPANKVSPVRAAIEIFERRNSENSETTSPVISNNNNNNNVFFVPNQVPKPKVPEKKITNDTESKTADSNADNDEVEIVQIVNIPAILPQRRCDSMYETSLLKRNAAIVEENSIKPSKSEEVIRNVNIIKPNTSFLWSINQDKSPSSSYNPIISKEESNEDWKNLYDFVDPLIPAIPPRLSDNDKNIKPPNLPPKNIKTHTEKIYEELNVSRDEDIISHSYEYCESEDKYEIVNNNSSDNRLANNNKTDDGYEYCASPDKENIYEVLPPILPRRQQQEPLPPRPLSRNSYCTIQNSEISNCYESIYNPDSSCVKVDVESTYESIYGCQIRGGSKRDSVVSSDQQSNSLYGRASLVGWVEDANNLYSGKATSELSCSDRSDEWVDVTDNEDNEMGNSGIIIVREKLKHKKSTGWSKKFRDQWSKSPRKVVSNEGLDSDSDHHYESLYNSSKTDLPDDDYDSFDSDTESENSFVKTNLNDSGVDIANNQLPDPPNSQTYVLTRLAATAGKHMRKLRRNWSLTKNDISKSLSRMTKRKSRTDLDNNSTNKKENKEQEKRKSSPEVINANPEEPPIAYQNLEYQNQNQKQDDSSATNINNNNKTLPRKQGFLNKFRRSMSLSAELASEVTNNLENKPKSTFYLTDDIEIDSQDNRLNDSETSRDSGASLSPVQRNSKIIRPQNPPPPVPAAKRATSWYAEVGLFKNSENNVNRRPNTFWYAEVGLYQARSTPSTSSAENSGNNINASTVKSDDFINHDDSEEYYNFKNGNEHYNTSIESFSSSETKKDTSLTPDIQLRLQDEPLYQFYDAAVLESVCHDGTSDFDSDGYEEVGNKSIKSDSSFSSSTTSRPSAMDLVSPNRNTIAFNRSLWCEIPEVIQSSVLSTLSSHQKKLQEAKFEMITSEASYLNSLNVLTDHFITSIKNSEIVLPEEFEILFGKVGAVKSCSEKLLYDLEKCWQDNILLHGVCDIVQKHAEENFSVYIGYCENQILLDETLKKIKERLGFQDFLKQLECSSACQSLSLYSFLMLPMQRITRWPLLVDAVLKRLSPQDSEYLTCQYALATINKIVNQCNEGARKKERENEMKKVANQLEFAKGVPNIEIVAENRWLIRSGAVVHMQQRTDETKLTFGKRFSKITLHLFLFNDLLFITKPKCENCYTIIHYCPRNLVELSSTDILSSLPVKDAQSRHLLFLTILENQNEKTVEFLLSCSSESDKERWIEALTPPKSEDPDETLYECWDCPQVTAVHNYSASQPDELALSRGDVINVLRKMADGWYHGERIRDGQTGWFPANYTVEIANPHVRSRNLKQRYRLLAFSENYLKSK